MKIQLSLGDCISGMRRIEANSIDLILCDLPYGLTVQSWDRMIPFKELWKQYRRIIKDSGTIVLFGKEPFSSALRMSAPDLYKYDWIWKKSRKSNYAQSAGRPLCGLETISVFSYATAVPTGYNRMTYNPQGTKQVRIPEMGPNNTVQFKEKRVNYPDTLLEFGNVILREKFHYAQKPVDLLEYLIRTHSNEGDFVLDNCMGSGSTAVAARNAGRNFIGFEIEPEFYEIAQRRLAVDVLTTSVPKKGIRKTEGPDTRKLLKAARKSLKPATKTTKQRK